MDLEQVYLYARTFNSYSEFESEIAKVIDNVSQTIKHNNKYVLVNKNKLNIKL